MLKAFICGYGNTKSTALSITFANNGEGLLIANRTPSRLWVKSTKGLIAGLPGGDGTLRFSIANDSTTAAQKTGQRERRKDDGEHSDYSDDHLDDGLRRNQGDVMELSDIKINIEFENLIPKQTVEQFKQLEENILKEGRARNPLVVWKDHGILVDGHHRLRILKANPSIEYSVIEQAFADEDEVKEWIIKNALGTRNLTEMQQTELTGRLHIMRKNKRGGDRKSKCKNSTLIPGDTAEQVAQELGVNRTTVYNASRFVEGLDKAEAVVPGFKDAVLTGEVKAQKQEVAAMRKQTPDEIKKSVETIKERKGKRNPSDKDITKKIREMDAVMSGVSTPQYGLAELIREIDTATDSFIATLSATLRRRKNVIDSYDGSETEIITCINNAIEKLNEMKKEYEK